MTHRPVPILMYHRVTPESPEEVSQGNEMYAKISVSPKSFNAQMAWFARRGYQSITLDDLMDAREQGTPLPRRSVILTFDDGYQDFADYAAPVLKRYGFTAHIFLVAGLVGGVGEWDRGRFAREFQLFDWDTARALEREGFRCDAHGMTHRQIGDLPDDECRYEILESQRIIGEELGREIRHFAYPHGSYNDTAIETLQAAGFRSACSVREGRSSDADNPFALRRVWPVYGDSLADFRWKVRFGISPRSVPRAIARKTRAAIRHAIPLG